MKVKIIFVFMITTFLAFVAYQKYSEYQTLQSIDSYEACIAAKGSIIQESYPATCITQNGDRYTETIDIESTYKNLAFRVEFKYTDSPKSFPVTVINAIDHDIIDLDICGNIFIGTEKASTVVDRFTLLKKLSLQDVNSTVTDAEFLTNGLKSIITMQRLTNQRINSTDWIVIKDLSNEDQEHRSNLIIYYWNDPLRTVVVSFKEKYRCAHLHNQIMSTFNFTN